MLTSQAATKAHKTGIVTKLKLNLVKAKLLTDQFRFRRKALNQVATKLGQ
jgi:hypothetical protein